MADIYLTREGYQKLSKELEFLKTTRRREISRAIGEAIAHGDISENAEYDSAKDAQAHNEKKIVELETKLSQARLIENENMPKDEALIGAKIVLKDLDSDEQLEYTLVSEEEADYDQGKISVTSPVGRGLLGHKLNQTVEINVPAGVLKYKIIKISRD